MDSERSQNGILLLHMGSMAGGNTKHWGFSNILFLDLGDDYMGHVHFVKNHLTIYLQFVHLSVNMLCTYICIYIYTYTYVQGKTH